MKSKEAVDAESEFAERLELFFGAASDALCHVYARVALPSAVSEMKLVGNLNGPHCAYAHTLPANFAFADRGPGQSLLAQALVPEPCFWTPDMPHLYRAELELRSEDDVVARETRWFGIRRLGIDRRKLVYGAKRWVVRAVCSDEVPETPLEMWRQAYAAMLVADPDDALCEEASRTGVLIAAEFNECSPGAIRRFSRFPAVGIVMVTDSVAACLGQVPHNLIIGQRFSANEPVVPAPWAQAAVCEFASVAELSERVRQCDMPILAMRRVGRQASVAEARAACDRMQAELAGGGDFAGYIV